MKAREPRKEKAGGLIERKQILDRKGIEAALRMMARKIAQGAPDPKRLLLLGIRTGGVPLAERLRELVAEETGAKIPVGAMDITLYRDDVFTGLPRPEVGATEIPCPLEGISVVLVDDVLFTGRTIRAALAELVDYGRPARVHLAVLVDRGHRELPIQPDYVGLTVETSRDQIVRVLLDERGGPECVVLFEKRRT